MTTSTTPPAATESATRAPEACWCLGANIEPSDGGDVAIEGEQRATLEELALLLTERAHGACRRPVGDLAPLASALSAPAFEAYVAARVNGLCEDGATELFRDTLGRSLRVPPSAS